MPDTSRSFHFQRSHPRKSAPAFALGCSLLLAAIGRAPAQEVAPPDPPQPANFGITCTLHDTQGRPVSEMAVEVSSSAPPLLRVTARTSEDGSISFQGLAPGTYDVTVAGGILIPPKRVRIDRPNQTLELQLPITLPQVAGRRNDTVSVEQLAVPENAREALRKAYEAWERNDVKHSRILAIHALQLHPYYGPALSLLGILELSEGHPADAIIGLQQAVQYDPNSLRTYLALASAYNELHNNTDALHALSIAAKLAPESWQLHYEIGRAYVGQGRFQAALDEFDRAQHSTTEERMVLHIGKAHALLGLHNYRAARAEFETVIRKSPDGPYAAESRELALVLDSRLKKSASVPGITAQSPNPARIEH
jgi:hypothetical protein